MSGLVYGNFNGAIGLSGTIPLYLIPGTYEDVTLLIDWSDVPHTEEEILDNLVKPNYSYATEILNHNAGTGVGLWGSGSYIPTYYGT